MRWSAMARLLTLAPIKREPGALPDGLLRFQSNHGGQGRTRGA
jgi:hypothetical protein